MKRHFFGRNHFYELTARRLVNHDDAHPQLTTALNLASAEGAPIEGGTIRRRNQAVERAM
jgi:hypothetical protein